MRFAAMTTLVVLLLAVFPLGAGSLDNDFVLDSEKIVRDRDILTAGSPIELLREPWWPALAGSEPRLYRPATLFYFAAVARTSGTSADARPFNRANLFLHFLNAIARYALVGYLLRGRRGRDVTAFVAALVPALHAISFESVVGIVGAAELLTALFMTLSWYVFSLGLDRRGPLAGGLLCFLSVALWFIALLAKETAVLFPLVLMLQVLMFRSADRVRPAVLVLTLVLAALAGGGFMAMRQSALGGLGIDSRQAVHAEFTTLERVESSLAVMGSRYLPEVVRPRQLEPNLGHQDVPPPQSFSDGRVLLGLAVWIVVLVWLFTAARRGPEALLVLFALVTYLPTSNLIVPIGALGAWRFLYSPLFGLIAALAMGAERAFVARAPRRFVLIGALGALTLFGALGTPALLRMWKNPVSLYEKALEFNENSVWALANLATARYLEGQTPPDLQGFLEALRAFDAMEDVFARLPGGEQVDRPTRIVSFRLLMDRAAAWGNQAQIESDPSRAADDAHRGVDCALRAEAYLRDDRSLSFDARLRAFRLRQLEVSLLRRIENRDSGAEDFTLGQAADDLRTLEAYPIAEVSRDRQLAMAIAASQYAELLQDLRMASLYLDRAAGLDPEDPDVASSRARLAQRDGNLERALACLEPVFTAKRARIEQYAYAAELLEKLGRSNDARQRRLAILDLAPVNPVEAQIRQDVLRQFGLDGGR